MFNRFWRFRFLGFRDEHHDLGDGRQYSGDQHRNDGNDWNQGNHWNYRDHGNDGNDWNDRNQGNYGTKGLLELRDSRELQGPRARRGPRHRLVSSHSRRPVSLRSARAAKLWSPSRVWWDLQVR